MGLEIYDELHSVVREHTEFVEKWIDFFYKNYPEDVRKKIESGICLDAGCGGTIKGVSLINKFNPVSVFACDINENHGKLYKGNKASFICSDIACLPFENNYFDFILCNGVAHHTPNPWKTIGELYRVLKPGGLIHISLYCFKNSPFHLLVILLRVLAKFIPFKFAKKVFGNNFSLNVLLDHAYVPYNFVYTKKEVITGLQNLGFTVDYILNVSESHRDDKSVGFLVRNERLLFGDGAILSFIGRKRV